MFCYRHDDRARGQCGDCGRALCSLCLSRWRPTMCDGCAVGRARAQISATVFDVVVALTFAGVGFAFAWGLDHSSRVAHRHDLVRYVLFTYGAAGLPFGWRFINGGSLFVAPWWIWLIVGSLKLIAAFFVGLVALPIVLVRAVRGYLNGRGMFALARTGPVRSPGAQGS